MAVVGLPLEEPVRLTPPAVISIKGKVCSKPQRLNINLTLDGRSDATRPLHVSIRFDKQVVVFNSMKDGKWDGEETLKTFPFKKDSDFELCVFVTENNFEFIVDRKFVYAYKQKLPNNYLFVRFIKLHDTTEEVNAPGFIVTSVKVEVY